MAHRIGLEIRRISPRIVRMRASNDIAVDEYGTTIVVEALMRDWLPAYWQHRTISLQHNLAELRGIRGKPFVGVARRVDFTPQLEIEAEIFDTETQQLIESGALSGASLEFVPLEERVQTINGIESRVYYTLAAEPEYAGLSLTDSPAVPGANILEVRSDLPAPWQFAVVDPAIFTAQDAEQMRDLMWFLHHDARTHAVDESLLKRAIAELESGQFVVPPHATLTREEVAVRAIEHLRRHTVIGIGLRSESSAEEGAMENRENNQKTEQLDINLDLRSPQEREADAQKAQNTEKSASASAPQATTAEAAGIEERAARAAAQAVAEAFSRLPEPALAAITDSVSVRSRRLSGDEILAELLMRSVIPQMQRRQPSPSEMQEIDNILRRNGINQRAITIEGNGTVIYSDLARQFISRPEPDIIARNHWNTVPMGGVFKRTFPRFDRTGITHTWSRNSTANIADSDPTLSVFSVEVTELNSKTVVPDSFSLFNAEGPQFIQAQLLPAMRAAAQFEEDRQFFLGNGSAPAPTTFRGLRHVVGATVVASGTNGDQFTADILSSLLRAMPVNYRSDVARLAYYLPVSLADDYGDILASRQTPGGDAWLERYANQPGPMPIATYRGIPIYSVPHLPTNETQGTSNDTATIYLVHRDIPIIGDALQIRIEPYRRENFIDVLQLQEFVGLGYQWPQAIVRRSGVRPR